MVYFVYPHPTLWATFPVGGKSNSSISLPNLKAIATEATITISFLIHCNIYNQGCSQFQMSEEGSIVLKSPGNHSESDDVLKKLSLAPPPPPIPSLAHTFSSMLEELRG